jgi:hypothetical protein
MPNLALELSWEEYEQLLLIMPSSRDAIDLISTFCCMCEGEFAKVARLFLFDPLQTDVNPTGSGLLGNMTAPSPDQCRIAMKYGGFGVTPSSPRWFQIPLRWCLVTISSPNTASA